MQKKAGPPYRGPARLDRDPTGLCLMPKGQRGRAVARRRRHFDVYCLEHSITPRIAIEANFVNVLVELVRLGRLATVLSDSIACAHRGLYPVILIPELPHHTVTLICRTGEYTIPACRAFGELAAEWCVQRCHAIPSKRMRRCPLVDVCNREARKCAVDYGSLATAKPHT